MPGHVLKNSDQTWWIEEINPEDDNYLLFANRSRFAYKDSLLTQGAHAC